MIKNIAGIIILMMVNSVLAQIPLNAEFTYQGSLEITNSPANGQFDFRFVLFDAEVDGTGANLGQINVEDLEVTDGLFTTKLDFGDGNFAGDKVWMEISIRDGAATGGYQQLLPRQQITATPYATHSQFVEFINDDAITASQISNNAVSSSEIADASIQAVDIADNAIDGSKITDGSVSSSDLAVNSVGSANIINNTITADDLATDSVGSSEIINNSINSAKIINNSITDNDLAAGSVGNSEIIPTQVQTRVAGNCESPSYLTGINQDGSVICDRLPIGLDYELDSLGIVGLFTSIAIGTDGLPIISYYDDNNRDLKVLKCTTNSCSGFNPPITLDSLNDVGKYTSIAIGSDGFAVISYYDETNFDLKMVKCTSESCSSFNPPIILDGTGNVDVGENTSITIGSDIFPIISYYDATNGSLKIVKCTTASCSSFNPPLTLDGMGNIDVGQYSSIAIGNDGLPIISYYDKSNGDLKVVKCLSISCSSGLITPVTLDSTVADVGWDTSIAINTDGRPIISYYDFTNSALKVVVCITANCSSFSTPTFINNIGGVSEGRYSSVAIGTDDLPIISYYDATNFNLKVTKCLNIQCVGGTNLIRTLDSAGGVGEYTSIAINADGLPIISYRYLTNGALKVYSCGDVDCKR